MPTPPKTRKQLVLEALESHERPLLRYATRLLNGDESTARDVVQHAFLKLCTASTLPTEVAPWLYTVCRNRAMDWLRKNNREPVSGNAVSELMPGKELDPAQQFERSALLRLIQDLISELSPSEREVAELWSQGFSNRNMSEIIGKTESAIRVRLHRAIQSIRRHPKITGWIQDDPVSSHSNSPISRPSKTIGQS